MAATRNPHVAAAKRYARAVIKGTTPACGYVRLACTRYLDDLEAAKAKAYPYRFDNGAAEHACNFIEALPHTKGHWAIGTPGVEGTNLITLEAWQCFIVCNLFGWLGKADGLRRYRETYFEIPRKNGKSVLAAAIALYLFAADGEPGGEVFSGATTERQAWEVFRPAQLMAKRTPALLEAFGIEVGAKHLHIVADASRFEPVIGKPGDGASPHCAVIDEYHEHKTGAMLDTMQTGMGARRQPLLFVITTAGSDIAGPCYALRTDAIKVLEGTVENDRLLAIIYTLDEGDDWTTPEALVKANPNLGVSVSGEYLKAQQQAAINSARKQATFKTKHLNVWVYARSPWMNMHAWAACADPSLDLADFTDEQAHAGGDVSAKKDVTSWCRVFTRSIEGVEHYYIFSEHWLPEDQINDPSKAHYQEWVNTGELQTTDGDILDLDEIELAIQDAAQVHQILEIGFDPWGAYQLMSNLQSGKNGRPLNVVEVPQTVKYLSEPMKWLAAFAEAGRLHHIGDPVLAWGVSNVVAREDANGNLFPRKERRENKIDPAVALIIAFNRVLMTETPTASVYEERGLVVLGATDAETESTE